MGVPLDWSLIVSDEELKRMYEVEEMTLEQIADKLGVCRKSTWKRLHFIGTKMRSNKHLLKRLYEAFMFSPEMLKIPRGEIAAKYGCSVNTVGVAKKRVYRTLEIYNSSRRGGKKKDVQVTVDSKQ